MEKSSAQPAQSRSNLPAHISFTQISTYLRCPEHYLFSYILGIKIPPPKAFLQGRAVHSVIEANYIKKLNEGVSFSGDDFAQQYETIFKQEKERTDKDWGEYGWIPAKAFCEKEQEFKERDVIDSGVRGLRLYRQVLEPTIQPVDVERSFEIPTNKIPIIGRIDLTTTGNAVRDTKTASSSPRQGDIHTDLQLTVYAAGYRRMYGELPAYLQKDYIVLTKEPKIVSGAETQTTRTVQDIAILLHNIGNVLKAIEGNIWYCAHTADSWVCSPEYCGYYNLHRELKEKGLDYIVEKYVHKHAVGEKSLNV